MARSWQALGHALLPMCQNESNLYAIAPYHTYQRQRFYQLIHGWVMSLLPHAVLPAFVLLQIQYGKGFLFLLVQTFIYTKRTSMWIEHRFIGIS